MLRKIKLYGRLAKFIGKRVLEADVASAAEAVRFLVVNFPDLEEHMSSQHYKVSIGKYDIDETELQHPVGQQDIRIIPVIAGAGAVGRIIAGVALIALSFVSLGGAPLLGAIGAKLALTIGASLALGGVAQLLTPVPQPLAGADGEKDPKKSYSFSGIQNTSRSGTPVPVVYGETLVGSVVVSVGIDTEQVTV